LRTIVGGSVFDNGSDMGVDYFIVTLATGGFVVEVDSTMFVEFIQAIDSVVSEVIGCPDGFVFESAAFEEGFWVYVGLCGERTKGELDEGSAFLGGFVVSGNSGDDAEIGAGREGLRAFNFGGGFVEDGGEVGGRGGHGMWFLGLVGG
jgi:hypothetical protein